MNPAKKALLDEWVKSRKTPIVSWVVLWPPARIFQHIGLPAFFLYIDVLGADSLPFQSGKMVFTLLLFSYVGIQIFMELEKSYREKICHNDEVELKKTLIFREIITEAMASFSSLVATKATRFRKVCAEYSGGNVFEMITRPADQIPRIIHALQEQVCYSTPVERDCIDINIISLSPSEELWRYSFYSPNRTLRTDPTALMREQTTARQAYEKETLIFYQEKTKLEPGEWYFRSKRDLAGENGSIICAPIVIETKDGKRHHVLSLNTYGAILCDKDDKDSVQFIRRLFSEYQARIELELTLLTLKDIKTEQEAGKGERHDEERERAKDNAGKMRPADT